LLSLFALVRLSSHDIIKGFLKNITNRKQEQDIEANKRKHKYKKLPQSAYRLISISLNSKLNSDYSWRAPQISDQFNKNYSVAS
jgi:hypothetical protein